MIINIDIDNTVNDFLDKFVFYLNCVGHSIKKQNISEYNLSKATGIDEPILSCLFFGNNNFYKQMLPLEGSVECINKLWELGHEIRFVTAITYEVISARIEFIKEFFPFIDPDRSLIVTNNKKSVYADIVIDDYLENLSNINKDCRFILFDQPWNHEVSKTRPYTRCSSWDSILHVIENKAV
jgi:5'(3')-deoxyribonucleotidase